jgi:hypothetical protein
MMKWFTLMTTLVAGFAGGIAAQRTTAAASIQGTVMDANTLPEEIEYWEVRSGAGESVVISGRKNITIIQSLRQAKGRRVRLSLEPPDQAENRY